MSDTYHLPRTLWSILNDYVGKCNNLGLMLDKYLPEKVFSTSEKKSERSDWLRELVSNRQADDKLAKAAYDRWYRMINVVEEKQIFSAETDWRMVVGLGGETVLETDITLHHLYGIPFIPGSALKGLTRAYAAIEDEQMFIKGKDDKLMPSQKIDTDHQDILRIFGIQKEAGTVIFFDAMPRNGEVKFALDIMNPHYPDYYAGNKPPTNDQNPIPVTFLTVTDTTFDFAIAPRNPKNDQHKKDVEQVREWLQTALEKYGIGGKTSAGYGYFKTQSPFARPNVPRFNKGDTIRGIVVDDKTDSAVAQYIQSGQAIKGLQYLPFPTSQVLILIEPQFEEAKQWKNRNTVICQFVEERVADNRLLLICEPRKK